MNYNDDDKMIYDIEMDTEEVQEDTSSVSDRRPRKKPRIKKKRRKKYYLVRLLVLILVCVAAYFFLHSQVFTIKNIQVEKNYLYSVNRVKELTGLKEGDNLFDISIKNCEKAMEERTYVREAKISRKLPDTVTVSLDVRVPVAILSQDGKFVMIDRDGYVLEKREKLPHYTYFEGITVRDATAGQVIKVKEEKLYQQYMELIDEMNAADLYFRKMVIQDNTVKLYAKINLYCIGEKKNIIQGMQDGNLKTVLYTLNKKGIKSGVVNVGDDKYYSYRKSTK